MRIASLMCAVVLSSLCSLAWGASTAITYQGQLRADALPANGSYDLEFALFDAATVGSQISSTVAVNGVTVTNGLFTVALDFGSKAFSGPDRWLEVAVQPAGGGGFTTLTPRQKLTPAPYALALPNLRTEPSQNGPTFLSANVIGGSTVNAVAAGVTGVVIAGGGATNGFPQLVNANYSVIGGGYSNTISPNGSQSTIAGGVGNVASSSNVAIGGGTSNTGSGPSATVGGGNQNVASGANATVPGGNANTASGFASFAAGFRAKAVNDGSFVWGDTTNADVTSTADDQMTIRASGGVNLTVNATNAISVPVGTLYRDNVVAAWGRVSSNTLTDAFNVASVVRNSAGNYTVVINTPFGGTAFTPVVSVSYIGAQPTTAAAIRFAATNQLLSNTTFNVFINNGLFAAADADFTFIVTGR
jgi:hypothetical protein